MALKLRVGTIHTAAGTGEGGYAGDETPAVSACLNEPKAVALDGRGNLLIADSENHLIRLVDRATRMIITVAGSVAKSSAVAEATKANPVSVSEQDDPFSDAGAMGERAFSQQTDLSGTVRYVVNGSGTSLGKRFGGDGGPARSAQLNFPSAVVADAQGHLYIADTMNHRIRRVEAGTGLICTIAGLGQPRYGGDDGPATSAGLNEPTALALSDTGVLYVADQSNNRVRAIDLSTGYITTVAGTGSAEYNGDGIPATEAALAGPSGLTLGVDGTLYIADTFNGRIRALDPQRGMIRTVIGDGGQYRYQGAVEPPSSSLSRPSGIAVDRDGNLYVTDSDNHLVRRWDRASNRLDRLAGTGVANFGGDGGPALEASLRYPFGVAIDSDGHLFIADTFNHRIREILL